MTSVYRLDRRFALQLFGWRMVLAGVFAFLAFLGNGFGGALTGPGWACAAFAVLMVAAAIWTMVRPPLVTSLTAQGFRLGRMAEGDVRSGHWTAVEKVDSQDGRLIFTLESGESGSIALQLVPRSALDLQRDVHERLNTAHGYRRLN